MHRLLFDRNQSSAIPKLYSSSSTVRAGRGALRVRAGGAAARRQSRQDKQRRKAEELRQAQQGQGAALGAADRRKRGGALQWCDQQDLEEDAREAIFLENFAVGGYFLNLESLGVLRENDKWMVHQLKDRYLALRWPAYEHSIAQYQATPSSSVVPPSRESAFDVMGKLAQELMLDRAGPAATDFPQAHSLLQEIWQPVLEKLCAIAYRSRFNSTGSVRQSRSLLQLWGELNEVSEVAFDEAHARVTKGAEEEEERASRASTMEAGLEEADGQEEPEPKQRPEVSAELRQQQEAKRAQRRAERAIRAAEAQARRVKEAEAAQRKAAYRVRALRRLQAAAEHRAAGEELQAEERAERHQRNIVRQTKEYARTHNKLSAQQRRILEAHHREAVEYNASR